MIRAAGSEVPIVDTQYHTSEGLIHLIGEGSSVPFIGEEIQLRIDWNRRYRLMRMHSCMHMLCSVVPAAVTGGSIRDGQGRLDFSLNWSERCLLNPLQGPVPSDWLNFREWIYNPVAERT